MTAAAAHRTMRAGILLARPHQFIVEQMTVLLDRYGYRAVAREPGRLLPAAGVDGIRGAIVSTAVLSSVKDEPLAVYGQLRDAWPQLPIMFATMVPMATYRRGLASALRRHRHPAEVLGTLDVLAAPVLFADRAVMLVDRDEVQRAAPDTEQAMHRWFDALPGRTRI